jgi:hypothetical protein
LHGARALFDNRSPERAAAPAVSQLGSCIELDAMERNGHPAPAKQPGEKFGASIFDRLYGTRFYTGKPNVPTSSQGKGC